jgi:hypothetical protein
MISLMDVHGALSHLCFAVKQSLEDKPISVKAEWENHRYLSVEVSCYGRDVQEIADRLSHGVLQGEYDYRFSVSRPVGVPDNEWTWVRAYPDMGHDDRIKNKKAA